MNAISPASSVASGTKRIVLIEGHAILRDGVRVLLESEADLRVVGSVGDAAAGLDAVRASVPDLVIVEVSLPDRSAVHVIAEIRAQFPTVRVLVLTAHGSEEYIRAALNAGAQGYVLKDSGREELVRAIRTVIAGRQYLCAAVAAKVVSCFVSGLAPKRAPPVDEIVTGRERQVLISIALGHSNKLMARALGLSVKTVEKHRANLMRKLTLHNAAAVTLFALRHGFIEANAGDGHP